MSFVWLCSLTDMALHLRVLLILSGLAGIHSVTTVSEVSVKAGGSISIPCLYDNKYRNYVKYLCKGYYWVSCSDVIKTNKPSSSTKFAISDDKNQRIFTVIINALTVEDTYYWCIVEINNAADVGQRFHLSVTRGTPSLSVAHQDIKGFKGDDLTINCKYSNPGEMKWCRLGSSCVTGSSVTINASVPNVFTVTMRTKSSGWYYCVKGGLQMPVHVTVTERPTTTTRATTRYFSTLSATSEPVNLTTIFADKPNTSITAESDPSKDQSRASFDLKSLIIPLGVLIFIVMVALLIWFMLKRNKQKKAESSAMTETGEDITYSTVQHKRTTSNQAAEDIMYSTVQHKRKTPNQAAENITYSTVQHNRKTPSQKPRADTEVDVTYSSVVTTRQQHVRTVEPNEENVTYSTLASNSLA